jgi:hypothetical protein
MKVVQKGFTRKFFLFIINCKINNFIMSIINDLFFNLKKYLHFFTQKDLYTTNLNNGMSKMLSYASFY